VGTNVIHCAVLVRRVQRDLNTWVRATRAREPHEPAEQFLVRCKRKYGEELASTDAGMLKRYGVTERDVTAAFDFYRHETNVRAACSHVLP
jgi:hypothetical protein